MVLKGHQPPSGPPSRPVCSTFSEILLGQEEFGARAKPGFLAYDGR